MLHVLLAASVLLTVTWQQAWLGYRGMVSSTTQNSIARIAQGALRRISQATAEQLTAQRQGHVPGFRSWPLPCACLRCDGGGGGFNAGREGSMQGVRKVIQEV